MKSKTSKRKIRIWSFAIAAVVTLCGFTVRGYASAAEYSNKLGITYERSLTELSEHMNSIETNLLKGKYAVTESGASDLAIKLWSEALAAKTNLSSLPTNGTGLDNTYKFLSQVGEFSLSLSKKLSRGEDISEEEKQEINRLYEYAVQINNEISELCVTMNDEGKWADSIKNSIYENDGNNNAKELDEGFNNVEEQLSDYPTLLYDGPFSDHILNAKPLFLEDKPEITTDQAAQRAAELVGKAEEELSRATEQDGIIPTYDFSVGDSIISITKKGGYCSYILNSRDISEAVYGYDECLERANDFLASLSFGSFKPSYYALNEGVCVINFAYTENDIVYYTDLIKIGVATDTGEIVSFNAQGYIMNHTVRTEFERKSSLEQAAEKISPLLTVESTGLAVIPLDTQKERLCYEFLCKDESDREILVYINEATLEEEKILILLKSDGGVLTK